MNKLKRSLLPSLALAPFILAGCATGTMGTTSPTASSERVENLIHVDHEYVGRIERHARAMNVDVYWVNPPQKRTTVKYPPITGDK